MWLRPTLTTGEKKREGTLKTEGGKRKEKKQRRKRERRKESAQSLQLKVIVEQRSENLKTLNSQREVTKLTNDQLSIIIKVQFGFSL